nr:MAG TPA: hypothetical protein [Caudoviricetes sp.]
MRKYLNAVKSYIYRVCRCYISKLLIRVSRVRTPGGPPK